MSLINFEAFKKQVELVTRDSDGDFYSPEALVMAINQVSMDLVEALPEANSMSALITTIEGPKQFLPEDALALLDVEAQIHGGRYIRRFRPGNLSIRDTDDHKWADTTSRQGYENDGPHMFYYEDSKPRQFWVWEPPEAGEVLQLFVSKAPPRINTTSTDLPLDYQWFSPLLDGVMFRLHDMENHVNERSERFEKRWLDWVERAYRRKSLFNPNNRDKDKVIHDSPGTGN